MMGKGKRIRRGQGYEAYVALDKVLVALRWKLDMLQNQHMVVEFRLMLMV
jgi:hypothetical protein